MDQHRSSLELHRSKELVQEQELHSMVLEQEQVLRSKVQELVRSSWTSCSSVSRASLGGGACELACSMDQRRSRWELVRSKRQELAHNKQVLVRNKHSSCRKDQRKRWTRS
jgi:hypothetical protein